MAFDHSSSHFPPNQTIISPKKLKITSYTAKNSLNVVKGGRTKIILICVILIIFLLEVCIQVILSKENNNSNKSSGISDSFSLKKEVQFKNEKLMETERPLKISGNKSSSVSDSFSLKKEVQYKDERLIETERPSKISGGQKSGNPSLWLVNNITGESHFNFDALSCHDLVWIYNKTRIHVKKKVAIALAVTKLLAGYTSVIEGQIKKIRYTSDEDIVIIVYTGGAELSIIKLLRSRVKDMKDVYVVERDLGFKASDLGKKFVEYQKKNKNCCGMAEYVKLEVFNLPYDQVLYLDMETKTVKSPEVLFQCDADLIYAAGPLSPLNAGILLAKPNKNIYKDMIETLKRVSHTYTNELCFEGLGCGPCKMTKRNRKNKKLPCLGSEGPQGFLHYYFVKRQDPNLIARQISTCLFNFQNDENKICQYELPRYTYPYITHKLWFNRYQQFIMRKIVHKKELMILSSNKTNTAIKTCRPDFWILGTRKGGTTSLYMYLSQHPRVASLHLSGSPQDGEVFTEINNVKKYNKAFLEAPSDSLVGDSNVARLMKDARNIVKTCGHKYTKFLMLLRDPIERCHSQMLMRARLGTDGMNMNSNISLQIHNHLEEFKIKTQNSINWLNLSMYPMDKVGPYNCINAGIYAAQLKRWLYHASITNIRIYFTKDFQIHTEEVVRDALQFIGVPKQELDHFQLNLTFQANRRPKGKLPPHQQLTTTLRQEMEKLFAPYNQILEAILGLKLPR